MTITTAEIMTFGGQRLPFSQDLREALANYARRTWPVSTSVHAAKAWGVSKDTAKNVLKGHASDATVTAIIRAGGWGLALPVIGAVIGEPIHEFLRAQTRIAAQEAERAKQHEQLAEAAWRRLESPPPAPRQDRKARKAAGAVGAETSWLVD